MTAVALRDRAGGGGELELVDAFTERALAIAASAAAPNTRRAYATAYRAFALFLRACYGQVSVDTFTVAAVAAWRDELAAQGLSPSTVAQRVSAVRRLAAAIGADPLVAQVRCNQVQHERPARCQITSSPVCWPGPIRARRSVSGTARFSSSSRARDSDAPKWRTSRS